MSLVRQGKVRDVYDIGKNTLILRNSDRISAFDRNWGMVPSKGQSLAQSATWWFRRTSHLVPNAWIATIGRDVIMRKCTVFPVEVVVRGFITGSTKTSLWTNYNRAVSESKKPVYCGIEFPEGLQKNQRLSAPVITPTTKGEVDEPISHAQVVGRGLMTEEEWLYVSECAMRLFKYGQQVASGAGLLLVDTKYEFGKDVETGQIFLIDEVHTCDSSRYWKAASYQQRFEAGEEPERFDKDVLRRYLKENVDDVYAEGITERVEIPPEVFERVGNAYSEFYEMLTGTTFTRQTDEQLNRPIEDIAKQYLVGFHPQQVFIVSGSESDKPHVDKIMAKLDEFAPSVVYTWIACSAHKETLKLMNILQQINSQVTRSGWKVVMVTVAGRSNALSGVVACNTELPVISCPPFKDKTDMLVNVHSSLQCPSKCPVMTILDPGNVAICVKRMMAFAN